MNTSDVKNIKIDQGWVDWIFWIDINKWGNALVFNDYSGQIQTRLTLYFQKVFTKTISSAFEIDKVITSSSKGNIKFDLIFCSYLFDESTSNRKSFFNYLYKISSMLEDDGNIVFGYTKGPIPISYAIEWIFGTISLGSFFDYLRVFCKRPKWRYFSHNALSDHGAYLKKKLYVFPNCLEPWTISDSDVFGQHIGTWKKKTRKNQMLFSLMSSGSMHKLLDIWWPHRIAIIGKQNEYIAENNR